MSLKIALKPNERMIISGAVVTNCSTGCELLIENNVPLLREKDIMSEKDATTPCKRIYFVIQLMYVDERRLVTHYNSYWDLVHQLVKAAPSVFGLIDEISELIISCKYYQALKLARKLIEYEKELTKNVAS